MNKEKIISLRMDAKLYQQLKEYAGRNDNSIVSITARRALEEFFKEQTNKL